MKRIRWLILLLLFAASVINYIDRQTVSILARTIQDELHISDMGYAEIVEIFLFAYMIAFLLVGWITDRLGIRKSMTLFIGWWSISDMLTGAARSFRGLMSARFMLGWGEAGLYTVAPKVVSEWFPPKERGLAVGIYTAGATIGATAAPPLIAWLTLSYGWRSTFFFTGLLGLTWCIPWLMVYRSTAPVGFATAPEDARKDWTWRDFLLRKDVLRLLFARAITDPVWIFMLFWLPKYLTDIQHMSLGQIGRIAWLVYFAADVGSLAGGYLSGVLVQRGFRPIRARQWVMTGAALLIPLSAAIPAVRSRGAIVTLAAAVALAHLAWMATLTTLAVDLFPAKHLGAIFGVISAGSGLGGIISTNIVGLLVSYLSYNPVFFMMSILHPLALLLIWKTGKPQSNSPEFLPITHKLHSDHDSQFDVGEPR